MTIKDDVLSFFQENFGIFSPSQVADELGFNRNTIRRVVQELLAEGEIERPAHGIYVGTSVTYRHYLASTAYCDGKKRSFYVLTFSSSDESLEDELFNRLIEETIDDCGNHKETGYSIHQTDEGRRKNNTYPNVEIGEV